MVRKIFGPIVGVVVAVVAIMIIEAFVNYALGPAGVDPEDAAAYVQAMPAAALIGVMAGYFVGSLFGGFIGARIAKQTWAAWVVAGVVLVATVINVVSIPHPIWFTLASLALIALGGWFAGVMAGSGGYDDEEDGTGEDTPAAAAATSDEPAATAWPAQGYDDPAPDIFDPDPEPDPDRPRWTPLPPRSED
jgi:hypothetical protein